MKFTVCLLVAMISCRERDSTTETTRPTSIARDAAPARCSPLGARACQGDDLVECGGDGVAAAIVRHCKDGCKRGACVNTCAVQGNELIYVVDQRANLLSFDPRALPGDPFHYIGALACDPASSPFSMAVDRRGIAWVLYISGKLYRVSIVDAHCAPVNRADDGPPGFGMGFASDAPGDEAETLYVAGNAAPHQLASVDTTYEPPRWRVVGPVVSEGERGPELTGTADAKLFGYFPEPGLGFVQEIDRATAKRIGPPLSLGAGARSGAGRSPTGAACSTCSPGQGTPRPCTRSIATPGRTSW